MAVRHDNNPKALQKAKAREAAKPGRQKLSGRGSGLTPRIRKAIELMIFGDEAGKVYASDQEAAEAAGVTLRTLRAAVLKPAVEAHYRQQMAVKRNGLKALGLNTLQDVMTDAELKKTAAGAKVRVDAAKVVLVDPAGAHVNVQVNTNVSVTPGYVLDLTPDPVDALIIDHGDVVSLQEVERAGELEDD